MDENPIAGAIDDAGADLEPVDDLALAELDRNDLGNARRLIARYGGDMLFVDAQGWHVWDSRRYLKPPDKRAPEAQKLAHKTAEAIADEAAAIDGANVAPAAAEVDRLAAEVKEDAPPSPALLAARSSLLRARERASSHRKWGIASGNSGKVAAMLQEAEPYLFASQRDLNPDPFLLNVCNGTIDLGGRRKKGEDRDPVRLRPHHRGDRITQLAPIDFDAEAACPEFDRFLALIVPDNLERAFLLRWLGYSLTSDISEQRIVVCWGAGSNGKSTLLKAIADALGDYAVHVPIETFLDDQYRRAGEATPDVVRLVGARMALASEPKKGARLSESVVKQCTGGERMTARRLYEGMFDFDPGFKLTLSANEKPVVAAQDHGTWRRVILFPFRITLNGTDKHISERLALERPGILNRLLDGWRDYREKGLAVPESIVRATLEYQIESDPVGQFLSDSVVQGIGFTVGAATLYQAYSKWTHANGFNPLSSTKFGRRLADLGMAKDKQGGFIVYLGIKLRADLDSSEVESAKSIEQ